MKNQLLFVVSSVMVVLCIYVLPAQIVDARFSLFDSIELQICIVQAVFLLVFQGAIDTKAIHKSAKTDKWSTYLILFMGVISQVISVVEYVLAGTEVERNGYLQFLFLVLALTGNQVRIGAILKLADNFTASIGIIERRTLVDTWLFAYIRHPSYLGALLFMLGTSLFLGSYLSFWICAPLFIIVYSLRIRLEENQLEKYFGEPYLLYKKRTWRLIPFLW